ncbi:hypothetical protein ACE3MZ_06010 [Paenibacillus sp. WLX1005]|uniref:hypothetical protein n=1 Tax=Paenibacillus sp. WLX1005 TaxID=3243766 RepID=UPI00398440EA
MLAGGIVCIIVSLPLIMLGFFGLLGTLPEDPGTAIVIAMVFALPGVILMTIGVRLIRKSNVQAKLQYEQMIAAQNWNRGNTAASSDDYHYPPPQPDVHSSGGQYGAQRRNESYKIYDPLDPRTTAYMNQQVRQAPSSSASSHSANAAANISPESKTVDCPGCGAPQTLAPHQSRECEYCGTMVAYK